MFERNHFHNNENPNTLNPVSANDLINTYRFCYNTHLVTTVRGPSKSGKMALCFLLIYKLEPWRKKDIEVQSTVHCTQLSAKKRDDKKKYSIRGVRDRLKCLIQSKNGPIFNTFPPRGGYRGGGAGGAPPRAQRQRLW